ncbi:aryl-sulfate sulfotransferase [Brachyspira pilosicoli]|uniref:aryl-sulfate sulfotransferase n=1 Tax=Brachyspira pilosicoli TaxID=52584 RepID=UPI0030077BA2
MKKILFTILLIISLFALSCKNNSSSSIGKIGEIVVNPYGVTPLSAVYTTETVNAAPITVTVKGLYGEPDIIHTYPAGYGTEFEIHGMFPESENIIEVNDGGRIITKNVSIGTISYNNINIQKKYDVEINNLPEEKYPNNPELYFIYLSQPRFNIAISRNGIIRYVENGSYTYKILKKGNGFIKASIDNDIYDFLGKKIINLQNKSHHDIIIKNNNYVYFSTSTFGSEDRLIEIDNSGNIIKELSFAKLIENSLDLQKYPEDEVIFKQIVFGEDVNNIYINNNGQNQSIDWCHANSLVYDSETDILYVSSRHRGVLSIDYSEWKLIWWMADETLATKILVGYGGIPYNIHFKDLKSLEAYRVKGDAINDGPKNQHALFLHKNGNLGMFDNQGDEDSNPNGSRYVEYKIIGTYGNYQAKKVYEYRYPSLYSRITSDVDFTGENYQNMIITYGLSKTVIEIHKDTKNILFKFIVNITDPTYLYRADKMPLYYDEGRVYSEDCNLKNPN